VSELVKRWQLVSSARELTAEGNYQLKPAVRGWHEMIATREPLPSNTWAKPVKLVNLETMSRSAGRQS
jgi:hypothetical protein